MDLSRFDLNLLRGLDVLLEERNVTRAAERLFITQQAASGTLQRLRRHVRGGLTAFVSTVAPDYAKFNVTINNMLPGPFDTDRMIRMAEYSAQQNGRTFEEEVAARTAENPAHRYGRPEEFGATCAFLCSAHAGFITGQHILIDGGSAATTF